MKVKGMRTLLLLSILLIGIGTVHVVAQQIEKPQMEKTQSEQNNEATSETEPSVEMKITKESFGTLDDQPVNLYTLTNSNGIEVQITNYEGIVVSVKAPDSQGNLGNIVLGYDSLADYVHTQDTPYFAGIHHETDERFHGLVWEAEEFSNTTGVGVALSYDLSEVAKVRRKRAEEKLEAAIMKRERARTTRELLEQRRGTIAEVKDAAEEIAEKADGMQEMAIDMIKKTSELSENMAEIRHTAGRLADMAHNAAQKAGQRERSVEKQRQTAEKRENEAEKQVEAAEDQREKAKQDLMNQSVITVRYTLTENNELQLEYTVEPAEEPELHVDNQMYFNLTGVESNGLGNHELFVRGKEGGMQPLTEQEIGQGIPVDYVQPAPALTPTGVEPDQTESDQQEPEVRRVGDGYLQSWEVPPTEDGSPTLVARVLEVESGRVVEIQTTARGLLFNTGTFLGGRISAEIVSEAQEATPAQAEMAAQPSAAQPTVVPRFSGFYVRIENFPEETPEEPAETETQQQEPAEGDAEMSSSQPEKAVEPYSYMVVYKFYAI